MPNTARPPIARTLLAPLHWIERARGRWRLALLLLYSVIVAAAGSLTWRALSLNRLPDIGDPFDVAAYRTTLHIPDEKNAFVLYNEAARRLKRASQAESQAADLVLKKGWTQASPMLLAWMDANGEALDLWRRGTGRPEAITREPAGLAGAELSPMLRPLTPLALLAGKRREAQGDMAGAWGWYRAVLRSSRHIGMHGSWFERWIGQEIHQSAWTEITRWATDPQVDSALLRQALDETIAIEALTAPTSEMLKAEYLGDMRELDSYESPLRRAELFGDEYKLWYFHLPLVARVRQFYLREPERSRRVIRLLYANLLAAADAPPSRQPPVVPPGVYDLTGHPEAPAAARALAPEQLASWLDSTLMARHMEFGRRQLGFIAREAMTRASLILDLARELYRREHGQAPPNDQALVGPYLKALPDNGLGPAGQMPPAP